MEEKPLLDSYSPFTGPATMFVTPLDPGTEYTFNLTGIHGAGGADSLLLTNVEFVLSANDGGGSNAGLIAGVVVGVVVGLALIGALVWWILRRKKRKSDKMTHMNDGSVVDLTHGQIAQVYPSYATRTHRPAPESTTSAMALGELPAFAPPTAAYAPASPSTTHGSAVFATPLQSPFTPGATPGPYSHDSPYGAPVESPFYPHSQAPSSPEHPSTDIPRAQINDLDDYFQARDSYMEAEWEDAEERDGFDDDEPRKGEPSRPPPAARALPVTQEQDAGRLVALPRPQSAALPEYRPSSQYVDHTAPVAHVEPHVVPHPNGSAQRY